MVIFHIGLPKTGTTFLQKNILSKAPDVLFVHRSQNARAEAFCMGVRRYVRADPLSAIWLRRKLRAALISYAHEARETGRVLVVSAENISVHSVLFWQGRDPSPEQVARRLAELRHEESAGLGPFRIIMGFRDQGPWLASRYAESGKDCPDFCQTDFDLRVREILSRPQLGGTLSWLDFSHVHARFARHFGRDNIHVYFLERLEAKPGWILEQIGRFIGGEVLGERFRSLGRQYRHDRRNVSARGENVWKLKSGQRSRLILSPELADAIETRFSAGNHALRQELRQKHLDTARATGDSGPAP